MISGRAWVTQANDPEDHFLHTGETLTLRPGAHALIGAEQALSLCFEADPGTGSDPDLCALWRRLRAALSAERRVRSATTLLQCCALSGT